MGRGKYLEGQHLGMLKERAGFKGDKCCELTPPQYAVPDSFN